MNSSTVGAVIAVSVLASVHLFAGALRTLDSIPRSGVLSFAGGTSVAYVFVHALPEFTRVGMTLDRRVSTLGFVEEHVYPIVLAGFVAYYGLERYVSTNADRGSGGPSVGVFWIHVGAFGAYNALIGYLLFNRDAPGVGSLGLYATAMTLHFLVIDDGLRDHHGERYHRYGRWLLAGAVVMGGTIGALASFDRAAVGALFAFLSGAIVLNVIKEELPPERMSRFSPFAIGAGVFAALVLLL